MKKNLFYLHYIRPAFDRGINHSKVLNPTPPKKKNPYYLLSMASKFSLILCIIFGICAVDFTNGASSSPSGECSKLVLAMTDCFSFLTNGSTLTQPEGSCCSGVKTIVNTAPSCLCGAFKSNAHLGVVLNVSKALTLPFACKVSAPAISNCGCEFLFFIIHLPLICDLIDYNSHLSLLRFLFPCFIFLHNSD